MKQFVIIVAILFSPFATIFARSDEGVLGVWLNDGKNVKVEIFKSGDKYSGKIAWAKKMYESDGKTLKKDSKNQNEKLRNRSITNLIILSGFTYDNGEWTGGEIYNPQSGKTYKGKMKLKGDTLEIRGYIGSPMFGKTTVWTRVS